MRIQRIAIGCLLFGFVAAGAGRAGPVILSTGKLEGAPGKEIVVPITLKGAKDAKGVRAMSMRLNYDPAILTYKSVGLGPTLSRAVLGEKSEPATEPGKLALGFACDFKTPTSTEFTSVEEDGVVLKAVFAINDDARVGNKSDLVIDNFRVVNAGSPPFEVSSVAEKGEVTVVGSNLILSWLCNFIGVGILVFLLVVVLIIVLFAGRRKKEKPTEVATTVPSFTPQQAAMFAHTCVKCGGVIQLPDAMKGQVFRCGSCGRMQEAGPS